MHVRALTSEFLLSVECVMSTWMYCKLPIYEDCLCLIAYFAELALLRKCPKDDSLAAELKRAATYLCSESVCL